jgi:hypothetical protein
MRVRHPVLLSLLFCFLLASQAHAQQFLSGRVRRKASEEVLQSVNVQNLTRRKFNLSDMGGNFRIPAVKGDTILFSSAGYRPDTAIVDNWMFSEPNGYLVLLAPNLVELPTLRVGDLSNYQLDSAKRSEDYAWLGQVHRVKLAGGKTFSDGVGVSFSPISYFSSREASRRRLRKRLKQDEKEYYIDSRFPQPYVARVTGLHGDSLQYFMYHYRPSYAFCRKSSSEDIFFYINNKVKSYRRNG